MAILKPSALLRGLTFVPNPAMRARYTDDRIEALRTRLRRQWLRWGLLPVMAVGFLALAASAVHASDLDPKSRQAELRLQAAMALAAGAFLAGFWLEGYKTATDRVLRRVASRLSLGLGDLTRKALSEAPEIVEQVILEAHWQAIILGWGAATAVVIAALVGMSVAHCAIVIVIALLYELYVLSRHHHALEVMAASLTGDLAEDAREMARRDAFRPTWPQRVAMAFGWRPSTTNASRQRARRHESRR